MNFRGPYLTLVLCLHIAVFRVFSGYSGFLPLHCLIDVYHVFIVYMFVSSLYDLRVLIKGCKTTTTNNQPKNVSASVSFSHLKIVSVHFNERSALLLPIRPNSGYEELLIFKKHVRLLINYSSEHQNQVIFEDIFLITKIIKNSYF